MATIPAWLVILALPTYSLAYFIYPVPTNPIVLISDFNGHIYRYDVANSSLSTIPAPSVQLGMHDIDYDPTTDKVYWTNIRADHIMRSNLDGTDEETVLSDTPVSRGVAVDYFDQVLFYTDEDLNIIGRINLTDMSRHDVITGLDNPKAIVLDMYKKILYWSEHDETAKVVMANYDGTNRTTLEDKNMDWPVTGLTLDRAREYLYWCTGWLNKIMYMNLATKKITQLEYKSSLKYYDIDILDTTMYYIDRTVRNSFNTIHAKFVFSGNRIRKTRLADGMSEWLRIEVFRPIACEDFQWGYDCDKTCGKCLDGDMCRGRDGHCPNGCQVGFAEPTCEGECPRGSYGAGCNSTCGHCFQSTACNPLTGLCLYGCSDGWHGEFCKDECDDGTFGVDCQYKCQCNDGAVCDKGTGTCPVIETTVRDMGTTSTPVAKTTMTTAQYPDITSSPASTSLNPFPITPKSEDKKPTKVTEATKVTEHSVVDMQLLVLENQLKQQNLMTEKLKLQIELLNRMRNSATCPSQLFMSTLK